MRRPQRDRSAASGAARARAGSRSGARRQRGVTILEIMIALTVLAIMAAAIAPMAKMTVQRQKEMELRRALRIMRAAVDDYKSMVEKGMILEEDVEAMGFPLELEVLVEGVQLSNGELTKKKFLRRIPKDPMTNSLEWGLRSYQDEADSRSWGRENVFDVYSLSDGVALDGTYYRDW